MNLNNPLYVGDKSLVDCLDLNIFPVKGVQNLDLTPNDESETTNLNQEANTQIGIKTLSVTTAPNINSSQCKNTQIIRSSSQLSNLNE